MPGHMKFYSNPGVLFKHKGQMYYKRQMNGKHAFTNELHVDFIDCELSPSVINTNSHMLICITIAFKFY